MAFLRIILPALQLVLAHELCTGTGTYPGGGAFELFMGLKT